MPKTINDVEREIAALLKAYEIESGEVVKQIGLVSIDTTTVCNPSPLYLQRVVVQTRRLPGNQWDC